MDFAELVRGWMERKLGRRSLTIGEARVVDVTHKRPLGARGEFARVMIAASPAPSFSFKSVAKWPASDNYDDAVLDGLLDELLATSLGPKCSRIAFELREIGWHDVDSCAAAFYSAARVAVREVLGPNLKNIEFSELWSR